LGIATTERWHGTPASPGRAEGRARLVRTPSDVDGGEEEIVIARHGTASLLPAVTRARAVVCEKGGMLSHLAVLARELGKPCVIGVPGILDAVDPGTWVVVDGAAGTVSAESARQAPAAAGSEAPAPPHGMRPVLQFGVFTAAFERTDVTFDVETALRIAALASVPSAFGLGAPWQVDIENGVVLVPEASFRETVDALVSRIEAGAVDTGTLRAESRSLVTWSGWARLLAGPSPPDSALLGAGVTRYAALNQLTWAASVSLEPLATRYRSFLWDRLGSADEEERQQLFLDSLIVPGASYILQSGLGDGQSLWRTGKLGEGDLATAAALAKLAPRRRETAQHGLARLLGETEAHRAAGYVLSLTDLVHLTERKNTDLHACGRALFASDANRGVVAALLRLDDAPPDPAAVVGAALAALERDLDDAFRADWLGPARPEP
jgi:phosphohistidine swiveling domain-containing protein